jgi:2-oxoisovalerate dehydrogenase E1 component
MHLFSPEVGMMGTSGIVGPSILQATGAGYSFKLLNTDRVGVAFFGDGASNNGAFHEGINLAAIWDLPVIFVCENNLYATEVAFSYATRNTEVAERAASYKIASVAVDGNDALAVYAAAGQAVQRARSGGGPSFIECKTYRTRPHSEGMRDTGYRTPEEVERWKARDPLKILQEKLLVTGIATPGDFEGIEAEIKAIVDDAAEFARTSRYPDPATVTDHIYSSPQSVDR